MFDPSILFSLVLFIYSSFYKGVLNSTFPDFNFINLSPIASKSLIACGSFLNWLLNSDLFYKKL